jgi:hypothetical protein
LAVVYAAAPEGEKPAMTDPIRMMQRSQEGGGLRVATIVDPDGEVAEAEMEEEEEGGVVVVAGPPPGR